MTHFHHFFQTIAGALIERAFQKHWFYILSPCCNLILVFSFGTCPVLVLHLLPLLCQIPPLLSWHLFTAWGIQAVSLPCCSFSPQPTICLLEHSSFYSKKICFLSISTSITFNIDNNTRFSCDPEKMAPTPQEDHLLGPPVIQEVGAKNGTSNPKNTETTVFRQHYPNWWSWHLLDVNTPFGRVLVRLWKSLIISFLTDLTS